MNARSLFKKKQSHRKIIIALSCLIILFFFLYFFILSNENKFIVIPANTDVFYIVPEDRGGEKVANLDKKSLNTTKEIAEHEIEKPDDLLFSIQFFTDSQMINVNQYLQKITNSDESIYNIDDFYILALTSDIGIEYFLLYKNFTTRLDATNYCIKFLPKMNNCLVVDTTKF
tara:strand:+ start:165 stop:680 length:516 start_codon:yes stop_codon:yes gene_type:complete